jgi:micrococcal nuclease
MRLTLGADRFVRPFVTPRRSRRIDAVFTLLLVLSFYPAVSGGQRTPRASEPCRVVRIVDGDSIECVLQGKRERIRLLGIDAPELRQEPFGRRAKAFVQQVLPLRASVALEIDVRERDRYGRLLAYVWSDSATMINEAILRAGFALPYIEPPNVRYAKVLRGATASARAAGVGLWATSAFACAPADYRRGRCR